MAYKVGDKIIILDYNNKPQVPHVVGEIIEIVNKNRYRLLLPDNACTYETPDRFKKISEDQYEKDLHKVHERERPLPVDLQINVTKFANQFPRLRKDILTNYEKDKKYISLIHAYAGRCAMYGKDNVSEDFMLSYIEAIEGIKRTRKFFHDLDKSIELVEFN
jgi:hypothetical protein